MKTFYMKLKNFLALVCIGAITFNSCTKSSFDAANKSSESMTVENNEKVLSARTSVSKAGIIAITQQGSSFKLRASTGGNTNNASEAINPEISLALVKEILPPTIHGTLVRVTHVAIAGNYAYVGYNREGDQFLGAIDVIDISDINNPRLVSSAGIPHMDISTVFVEGNNLHFTGSADPAVVKNIATPAVGGIIPLSAGYPTASYFLESFLGTTATDLVLTNDFKYIVTGSFGEIVKINKSTNQVLKKVSAPGLLSVRTNDSHVIALSAEKGLLIFDKDLNQLNTIQTIQNNVVHRRMIEVDNNYAFVSEGVSGLGVYDLQSGALVNRIPVPAANSDFPFVDADELTTIALSFNNNRAFIANGAAGISVYKHGSNPSELSYIGSADLNVLGESSSNYILVKDEYVFVAGGKGGLKILKLTNLTETQPSNCSSNLPKFEGNTTQDFNTNQSDYSFADSKVFSNSINIGSQFLWCGSLEARDIRVNGGGQFNMSGSLVVKQTLSVNNRMVLVGSASIHQELQLNGGGNLSITGSVAIGAAGSNKKGMTVNGNLTLDGEISVYGDLRINGGGSIAFTENSRIIVYGDFTDNSKKVDLSKITVIK